MKGKIFLIGLSATLVIVIIYLTSVQSSLNDKVKDLAIKEAEIVVYQAQLDSLKKRTKKLEKLVEMSKKEATQQAARAASLSQP